MKINKKHGIVFWITGLSGSGKSDIGNKIVKNIDKKYGKTIIIHGDDIRNIYNFKSYDLKSRLKLVKNNSDLCNLLISSFLALSVFLAPFLGLPDFSFFFVGFDSELMVRMTFNRLKLKDFMDCLGRCLPS